MKIKIKISELKNQKGSMEIPENIISYTPKISETELDILISNSVELTLKGEKNDEQSC